MTKLRCRSTIAKKEPTLYATLGIAPGATYDELHAAYKKLALEHHPDRGGNAERFAAIALAHGTLRDDERRAKYDAQLRLLGRLNCLRCEGLGIVRRQKTFSRCEFAKCNVCGGTGEV